VLSSCVTKQKLREPVASAHQIATRVFARTNEITRRLLFQRRDPYWSDLAEPKQPRHPLGAPSIGLDPIGCSSDPRQRRNDTIDPRPGTPTRDPRRRALHTVWPSRGVQRYRRDWCDPALYSASIRLG
jgi:hypothetical protein